jgi:hypothetical protein
MSGRSIRDRLSSWLATMIPVRITVATNPNVAHPAQSTHERVSDPPIRSCGPPDVVEKLDARLVRA